MRSSEVEPAAASEPQLPSRCLQLLLQRVAPQDGGFQQLQRQLLGVVPKLAQPVQAETFKSKHK